MVKKEDIKIHSVQYNFIMNTILKMSGFIFPLITFPYISRVLGAEGNGKIEFANSVIYYFSTVACLGIPTYGIRICAQCRDDKEKLSRTVQELLIITFVMTVISYMALIIVIFSVPKLFSESKLMLISSISLLLSSFGVLWFYQAVEQYAYITYRNLAVKVVCIILMFVLVKDEQDYVLYAAINIIASLGANIINLLYLRKIISLKPLGSYKIKRHIKPILLFFMLTIATSIYTHLDSVMLGFLTDDAQVGYYNAAIKLKSVLLNLVVSLATVLLPRASYYIERHMFSEFKKITKTSFQFTLLLGISLVLFFMVESEDSIYFLAGDLYNQAILPMIIITPTVLLIGISNITGIQILVPFGLEKYTIISTIWGAVVDFVLNLFCIPKFGASGAAFGTLIAEIIVLIVQVFYLKKNRYIDKEWIDWIDSIKIVVAAITSTIILMFFKMLFNFESVFLNLFFAAIIYFSVYGVILLVANEIIVKKYFILFKDKLNKFYKD